MDKITSDPPFSSLLDEQEALFLLDSLESYDFDWPSTSEFTWNQDSFSDVDLMDSLSDSELDIFIERQGSSTQLMKMENVNSQCISNDDCMEEKTLAVQQRREDILSIILQTWNAGDIEDYAEIAPSVYDEEVTFISPDNVSGLRGISALMKYWSKLWDAFPDGVMEKYEFQESNNLNNQNTNEIHQMEFEMLDNENQYQVDWVFTGTHINTFEGIPPQQNRVRIVGKSYFTFKGDKIYRLILSWNYQQALLQLLGSPERTSPFIHSHHITARQ